MNYRLQRILLVLLLVSTDVALADEDNPRFGPKKGVSDVSKELGFKLNASAYANFKIQIKPLPVQKPWRIPRAAIAFSKAETHVFVQRDGYFKTIDVKILKRDSDFVVIQSDDLKVGDLIVTAGAPFLSIVNESVFGEELSHEH